MLTARAAETDRVVGLELGADDYVTKPFSPRELVARVRAVLRRHEGDAGAELLRAADLSLDVARMRVEVAGRRVDLTPTEFALVAALARQPGRVFTRSQLLDAIHGLAFESYERAIDAHVKNIRRKLEPDPRQPRYPPHRLRRWLPAGRCLSVEAAGTADDMGLPGGPRERPGLRAGPPEPRAGGECAAGCSGGSASPLPFC